MNIRPATAEDADALSAVAFASKASWGYSAAQMAIWRDRVTIRPDSIAPGTTWCAEIAGEVIGFCQISRMSSGDQDGLEHLWVHPDHMRAGVGAALLRHVRMQSTRPLLIHAEPESQAFYEREGARVVSFLADPTEEDPERVYPLMILAPDGTCSSG